MIKEENLLFPYHKSLSPNFAMKNIHILVLGINGMVGSTVFRYLKKQPKLIIHGTIRNKTTSKNNIFLFDAKSNIEKLKKIIVNKKIDYIINCIGVNDKAEQIEKLTYVNALFPHLLENLAKESKIKIIHISTDAVFKELTQTVTESSQTSPEDIYGTSKLLGETQSINAITFRTSFVGFDKEKHKGILEKALKEKNAYVGFANHIWTGCTTLQFAQICCDIIIENKFTKLRKKSSIFHFSPLGPISKYELIKIFYKLIDQKVTIKKSSLKKRIRILETNFAEDIKLERYILSPKKALEQLISFEN